MVGCGFIGSHVVAELAARGRNFTVLTRSLPPEAVTAAIEPNPLVIGDATDRASLEAALEGVSEVVYCAGGSSGPDRGEPGAEHRTDPGADREPARRAARGPRRGPHLHFLGGDRLRRARAGARARGCADRSPGHLREAAPRLRGGDRTCERDGGLNSRILRCSTLYGEHQQPDRGQGAVVTFLDHVEREKDIVIYGDGGAVRDYLYAGDVARVILDLLDLEDVPPILNVGSGVGVSLSELVEAIEREVGKQARVETRPERGFEVHRIVLDIRRLRALLDFEPLPLADGVSRTHAWLASTTGQTA